MCLFMAGTASVCLGTQKSDRYDVVHRFDLDFTPYNLTSLPEVHVSSWHSVWGRTRRCEDGPKSIAFIGGPIITIPFILSYPATAPASTADARAEVVLDALPTLTEVRGSYGARGSFTADTDGCNKISLRRSAGAEAASTCQTLVRAILPSGTAAVSGLTYDGTWLVSSLVGGRAGRKYLKDPVYARMLDDNFNEINSWKLMDVTAQTSHGRLSWGPVGDFCCRLRGAGREYQLVIEVGSPVLPIQEWGRIEIRAESNVLTQCIATGRFRYLLDGDLRNGELPQQGATPAPAWDVPVDPVTMTYDLGPADPVNDRKVEITFQSGARNHSDVGALCEDEWTDYVSNLGNGCDGFNTSIPQEGLTTLGYSVNQGQHRLMAFCEAPAGAPTLLDVMTWPVYQESANPVAPPQAVYVRLWNGDPLNGGTVLAGNLTTNRLENANPLGTGAYRTDIGDPKNCSRPIRNLLVNMDWAPPLNAGQMFGIEVVVEGAPGTPAVQSPATPFPEYPGFFKPALQYDVQTQQWSKLSDGAFDVQIPFRLWADVADHCDSDLNSDDVVDDADFALFVVGYNLLDCFDTSMDFQCASDFNGDQQVDDADFSVFVVAYNALICPE